jgi:hypothetical protein
MPLELIYGLKEMRDRELYHVLHKKEKFPRFPMNLKRFVMCKKYLEKLSLEYPYVCLCFMIDGECHVLNEGTYMKFSTYEDATKYVHGIPEYIKNHN